LGDQIKLIEQLIISQEHNTQVKGINILVYGPPGTGKTELAKMVAKNIGYQLHEISMSDEDGDPIRGKRRFSSYQLAQHVLKRQAKSMIVFDEIEDVFPSTVMSLFGSMIDDSDSVSSSGQKAWINHLLENNEVPAIWISNSVSQIDNAYKRRFKFVLKMDIPPKETRLKIIKNSVKELAVSQTWLNNVSDNTDLSPALITQSAQMVSLISKQSANAGKYKNEASNEIESRLNQILNNSLEVMGKKKIKLSQSLSTTPFNIKVLNPDRNISNLVKGLHHQKQGRICFYGPPGTGKTAFAHYIAKQLDQKLLVKRSSDLIDKYVGESEKNIAQMFEQAKQEKAVLLLDEADSFLTDRKGAQQSWEITQVNELLTQMENFEGIFICSTNLINNLDEASIRRFDLKIKLDYMTPEQSFILFKQVIKEHNKQFTQKALWKQKLSAYHNLTPGDFATVIRQNRLSAENISPAILFEGLVQESQFKSGEVNHRGIGFAAHF